MRKISKNFINKTGNLIYSYIFNINKNKDYIFIDLDTYRYIKNKYSRYTFNRLKNIFKNINKYWDNLYDKYLYAEYDDSDYNEYNVYFRIKDIEILVIYYDDDDYDMMEISFHIVDKDEDKKYKTIAEKVYSMIDDRPDFYWSGRYSKAIDICQRYGGIEVYNYNWYNDTISFAPDIVYKFKDNSKIKIGYSGIRLIEDDIEEEIEKEVTYDG